MCSLIYFDPLYSFYFFLYSYLVSCDDEKLIGFDVSIISESTPNCIQFSNIYFIDAFFVVDFSD